MSSGYISEQVRTRVQAQAQNRCGYCLSHQDYVLGTLEIEHFIPRSKGGTDEEENLWIACSLCNTFGSPRIPVEAARCRAKTPVV